MHSGFCGLHSVKPQFSFFIANKKLIRDFIGLRSTIKQKQKSIGIDVISEIILKNVEATTGGDL